MERVQYVQESCAARVKRVLVLRELVNTGEFVRFGLKQQIHL